MIVLGVALAGALGASVRFVIERAFLHRYGPDFPWASYLINPLGSFLLGTVTGLALAHGLDPDLRTVLATGFCGSFTVVGPVTFDSLRLAVEGAPGRASCNLVLGTAIPIGAAAAGLVLSGGI